MTTDRPTFSENWHRVAGAKPKLRPAVRSFRQRFRGRMWHVLTDPANNQFFRLDEAAWHFVGLLDGRRTVEEAWRLCNEQLGDEAPTQGEAIRLLGQLYTANLLQADLPPDAAQMFHRHRKRVRREVGGQLTNFLFVRIPLFDPNRILQQWVGVFGWVFSPVGFVLWVLLIGAAGYQLAGRFGELWASASPQLLLRTDNLLLLYAAFVVIKALHEFGHGFACARFGRREGLGGEVHTIGIMLLVFMPVPYVDASSAWAFRSKGHRAIVGAAGMYVEIAAAAVAAVVWANTAPDTIPHALSYNAMFLAGFSTLLFNGNPLLRFDGYYILSDLLEIANLSQRSRQYLYHLVRRYIYGVRAAQAPSPAHSAGERIWLTVYAIASTIYRVLICVGIILYVADMLFLVGVLLAIGAVAMWVIAPLGKLVKYLATSPELARVRGRAVGATVGTVGLIVAGLGGVPVPERGRAQGVVEPRRLAEVHTDAAGVVRSVLESGTRVRPDGPPLIEASNRELELKRRRLEAELRLTRIRREKARGEDPAKARALGRKLEALRQRLDRAERQLTSLTIHAPFEGVWFAPDAQQLRGVHLKRGERVGMVAGTDDLLVRAVTDQFLGPRIEGEMSAEARRRVELRVQDRPAVAMTGRVERVLPAGRQELPSAALGYAAGGTVKVARAGRGGRTAAEPFFEVRIDPQAPEGREAPPLRVGQRVAVRFTLGEAPLLVQWWRDIRQIVQQRFSVPDDAASGSSQQDRRR